jgi:threonine dehydratase
MPRTAPEAKKAAVRGYGGTITECEPSTTSREAVFAEVHERTGADFVHPYNDPRVIAGQATCSRELMEQVEGLDAVIAPIGGGGMVSGCCLTLSNIAPKVEIYAAEPEQADDAYRSFKAGHIIADDAPVTIADGLKVPLKERTWHFVSNYVTDILTASEEEIIDAMKLTWQRMKIVMEPSCAVPLATIIKNPDVFRGKRVGVDRDRRQCRPGQAALDELTEPVVGKLPTLHTPVGLGDPPTIPQTGPNPNQKGRHHE